ncbi:hypothetical protein LR003_01195 [candidate division NPL-UPA2 bacterium]|nr:hypothetical protein [candidate division NPL-UPA2 bacterium]
MGFLKRVFSKKGKCSPVGESQDILWLHIKCNKCGKVLKLFINKNTDLESQYKESGETGPDYILKKEAMDDKCLTGMFIQIEFDRNRNILSREIINGEFINEK